MKNECHKHRDSYSLHEFKMNIFVIKNKIINSILIFSISFFGVLLILKSLNVGCKNIICNGESYYFGLQLLLACIAFGVIGGVINLKFRKENTNSEQVGLIFCIAIGQVAVIAYIYIRSFINQLTIDIPITRYEVWALVIFAIYVQISRIVKNHNQNQNINFCRIVIELLMLFAICVVIADRELPKLIMLSSDPDIHAYFALQIQRLGGIPYMLNEWGIQRLTYPAGSGALIYSWFLLGYLDVRNALAALPLLFTFLATLLIAEQMTKTMKKETDRLVAFFAALTLTAAGFLIPIFAEYSHLEGVGRQISIFFIALFCVTCLDKMHDAKDSQYFSILLMSFVLFVLAVLNPINIILPIGFLFVLTIHMKIEYKKNSIILMAVLFGAALLLLDPYYVTLFGMRKVVSVETVSLQSNMLIKTPAILFNDVIQIYKMQSDEVVRRMGFIFAGHKLPLFAILLSMFGAFVISLSRGIKIKLSMVFGLCMLAAACYFIDGTMQAFGNDKRFYNLQRYIDFSFAQFKIMALIIAIIAIVKLAFRNKIGTSSVVGLLVCLIIPATLLIRSNQEMNFKPRQPYCGSMGCFEDDDKKLLEKFEDMVKEGVIRSDDGGGSRVLIPNLIIQIRGEKWLFPISSARVLPHYNVLPAAFYYYQGSQNYSTESYDKNVCQVLDREWLAAQSINYLFLPTDRSAACIAGMNDLITSEEVVLQVGNSYLLKFKK